MLLMHCPKSKAKGTCSILVCLYKCPKGAVAKCTEYAKKWDAIKEFKVEDKYKELYGEETRIVPLAFRKRRKRKS